MNARDELAEIMEDVIVADRAIRLGLVADAVLAAGYRKPLAITTAADVNALHEGSIVRSDNGGVWERVVNGPGSVWRMTGSGAHYDARSVGLPATVLHEPQP